MSVSVRSGLRVGLTRPGVFCVVAVALTLELLARVVVGVAVNPFAAVLLPPFLGALVLGGAFPVVRAAAVDGDAPWVAFPATVGARWPSLLAFAAVGHLVALVVGTGLFLVCDTAVRFVLYWTVGEHLPAGFHVYLPLFGVGGGAFVAWSLLSPALAPLLDEEAPGRGLRAGLRSVAVAAASPRRSALFLGLHAAVGVAVAGTAVTGLVYTGGVRSLGRLLVVGGGLSLLTATVAAQFVYPLHVAAAPTPFGGDEVGDGAVGDGGDDPDGAGGDGPFGGPSTRRVAVAVLLCVAAVAGAGAVRVTDTRPVDTAADPLPDDPTAAYATALENLERTNHAYVASANGPGENRSTARRVAVDRRHRRYLSRTVIAAPAVTTRTTLYGTSGVVAYATESGDGLRADGTVDAFADVHPAPAYWTVRDGIDYEVAGGGRFSLPQAETGEWTVAGRSNGRTTLALTGPAAYEAAFGHAPPPNRTVERARVQMVVDDDRGVVTGGDATVRTSRAGGSAGDGSPGGDAANRTNDGGAANATGDGEAANATTVTRFRYDVTVGGSVRRPDGLGSPTAAEWAWRLFAY